MIDARALSTPFFVVTLNPEYWDVQESWLRRRVEEMGRKYAKSEVGYTPTSPPPAAYRYECIHCRFFTAPSGCEIVRGYIDPAAYCVAMLPPRGEAPMAWMERETRG